MEENLRDTEGFTKQFESKASNSNIDQRLHWKDPRYSVAGKIDGKIDAFGGNSRRAGKENGGVVGIEVQEAPSAMPVKSNVQGGSGLKVQVPGHQKAAESANNKNVRVYVDLTGILDARAVGSGENVERMRQMMAVRGSNSVHASKESNRGMQNSRSFEAAEDASNGGSASASRLNEFQKLSLSSENVTARIKFMCSFGGKILPRPSDGKLRYVGGETRIITVNKGISYADLMQKLMDVYGQALILKYQLPDEDLDALVSVSSDEDLENMMEEYGRLEGGEGSSRLRVFLFSAIDHELAHFDAISDKWNSQQCYVDAVNGILDPGVRKQTESTKIASIQMSAQEVTENWYGTPRAQVSIIESFLPAQDMAKPIHILANATLSSKQSISCAPVTLLPSLPMLSSLPFHPKPSGVPDISMGIFPEQPSKVSGHSYNTLRPTESQNDMDYGGTITSPSQQGLHYRFPESRMPDLPAKTEPVFSSNPDLLHGRDQSVIDAKLPKVGSQGNISQMQEEVGMVRSSLDHSLDVQPLYVDSKTIIFQYPPSSACQAQWQDKPDSHQDCYIKMDHTQNTKCEGGHLQLPLKQHVPISVHLNGHPLPSNEVTGFGNIDQARLEKVDMLNGLYIQRFVSTKQTGHTIGGTAALRVVESDPPSPSLGGQQRTGNLQPMEVQHLSIAQKLEQVQYELNVNQYNDQDSRVLFPSTSTDSYRELNSEQFSHQQVFSCDQQYGCQQAMPHGQASRSNECFILEQELSHAFSDTLLPDHRVKPFNTVYEGVLHSDGLVRPTSLYTGPSTIQDQLTSLKDQHNSGGERSGSSQHVKEAQLNLAGLQSYFVSQCTSEYVVPQPSTLPHFHEKPEVNDGLFQPRIMDLDDGTKNFVFMPKMPETEVKDEQTQLLGSSHAQPGQSYSGMDFPEELNMNLGSGFNSSDEIHRTEIFKPFEVTNTNPTIAGQSGVSRIFTEASKATEITSLMEEFGVPLSHSSHGTGNHTPASGLSSLIDDNDINFSHVQPNVLTNTSSVEGEKASSISEVVAMTISTNDFNMPIILSSDLPTLEPLQTSRITESTAYIPLSYKDIPLLSSDNSVLFDFQFKGEESASTCATTNDNADDCVKVELRNIAENIELRNIAENVAETALQLPLLPAPTLSVNDWPQDESLNVRLMEGVEEDNLMIEEETKIEDSDNDDPLNDAIIAEAEAIVRGLQTIKNADLEQLRELGSGTFGTVYHGKWRGSDVAIKRIKNCCFSGRASQQDSLKADFWSEACMLAQLHHPNIVAFYGVVPDGPGGTLGTVTEFMVNGSLKQNLQRKDRPIDHRKRILIATDAAIGMEYLHSKNIVHFDLKCDNLLVNMKDPHRPICKVADFGLSKIKHQTLVSGGVRGSLPWMAPELLNGSSSMVCEKVDVFSFGIVMWELLEGKEPYAEMHYGAIIGGIVSNTLRPLVPARCEPLWRSLMERCWSADPAARPSFSEIVDELRSMLTSLFPKGQGNQNPT